MALFVVMNQTDDSMLRGCTFNHQSSFLHWTLQHSPFSWLLYSVPLRQRVTHLVIDDGGGQTVDQDLLLLLVLKLLCMDACSAKVVILSASMQQSPIHSYFSSHLKETCGVVCETEHLPQYSKVIHADELLKEIPGFLTGASDIADRLKNFQSIQKNIPHFLFDLVAEIILYKARGGDVFLIFLPGSTEMRQQEHALIRKLNSAATSVNFRVISVCSSLVDENRKLIQHVPNRANIIISTSIVEDSIFLPKVNYVIDFGLEKMSFDTKGGLIKFTNTWSSKQTLKQRIDEFDFGIGLTVIRLFTRKLYEGLQDVSHVGIGTAHWHETLLKLKIQMCTFGSTDCLLQQLLHPPSKEAIDHSINYLKAAGAIQVQHDGGFTVTQLGKLADRLALDIDTSRLIILGLLMCCSVECVIIAAGLASPVGLFKQPYFQSMLNGQSRFQAYTLQYFKEQKFFDDGMHSDMLIFCNIYGYWIQKSNSGKNRISRSCLDQDGLLAFVTKVQWLASEVVMFLEEEKLIEKMRTEYEKLSELCHGRTNHVQKIFCSRTETVLLAIAGAYNKHVIIGKVPDRKEARNESMEILSAGLDVFATFKLENVPWDTANDSTSLTETLQVLGPISKVLVSKDNNEVLAECLIRVLGEKQQSIGMPNLPDAIQAAYFLTSQQRSGSLELAIPGPIRKSVCIGKPTRHRQIFWNTYVKGQNYRIQFNQNTNLPQYMSGMHDREDAFLVAVSENFLGGEASKILVSASTLLPSKSYFSVVALLLFRPFQTYLIRTDSTNAHVYSLQYGPLKFDWTPHCILIQQLHLIEEIRAKINLRMLDRLYQGNIVEEVLQLLESLRSQSLCDPDSNPILGEWQEYPVFRPIDIRNCYLSWKLNMESNLQLNDRSKDVENQTRRESSGEPEDEYLLKAMKMVEPDLERQTLEEWIDGNKQLNVTFYSILEKLVTKSQFKEQAKIVLRFIHNRTTDLVPKKKQMEVESWYHIFCNPLNETSAVSNTRKLKISPSKETTLQNLVTDSPVSNIDHMPMVSKTIILSKPEVMAVRRKISANGSQVKIVFSRDNSQSEKIFIFGPPGEVEDAANWIKSVSLRRNIKYIWTESINDTYFLPEDESYSVTCVEISVDREARNRVNVRRFSQFILQGTKDNPISHLRTSNIELDRLSNALKARIREVDKSAKIEVQARLGSIIFSCLKTDKSKLPFQNDEPLRALISAWKERVFIKQRFNDTVTKDDFVYIRACLRMYKPTMVKREKKVTVFLVDPIHLDGKTFVRKITFKDSVHEPGKFELIKVQKKEQLAHVDISLLERSYVKSDIRLSVMALFDEQMEDCYADFVSNIRRDGALFKYPRSTFNIGVQRVKNTEEHIFEGLSVSLNEITQLDGKECFEKYEVEIAPIECGESLFSVQNFITHMDTILSRVVIEAQNISKGLFISQPSTSITAVVHSILCSAANKGTDYCNVRDLLFQHVDNHCVREASNKQSQKSNLHPMDDLICMLRHLDDDYFNGTNLSISLVSILLTSLKSIGFSACISSVVKAQEVISSEGFAPQLAIMYASMFKCQCWKFKKWVEVLAPHLLEIFVEDEGKLNEICHQNPNISEIRTHLDFEILDFSVHRALLTLRRHWVDRNVTCFARMYNLCISKSRKDQQKMALIQTFITQIFCGHPSKVTAFVLDIVSLYLHNPKVPDESDNGIKTSLIHLIDQIKDLKVPFTKHCQLNALNLLVNLKVMNDEVQAIEQRVFEAYQVDEAAFRNFHYRKILTSTLSLTAIHREELERRGLTYEMCQSMELASWKAGKKVVSSSMIPGLNKQGNCLIGSPGIFIPARDPFGQITGAQIKVDNATTGKYKWLSSNKMFENGRGPSLNDEWPLFCCMTSTIHTSVLAMCEGGLKAHVLSFLSGYPVIGASGANFWKSRNLLERYLAIIDPYKIIFFPDAGSQCNDQVCRCYFQTFRIIREYGYSLVIAWWGQVNKLQHEDIDDLLCKRKDKEHVIPLVSPIQFWHLLDPAVRKKLAAEFPDYSGDTEFRIQEELIDDDEIRIARVHPTGNASSYEEFLLSIPKHVMKVMPPPPNDFVTPASITEFTVEIRVVRLVDVDTADSCAEWLLMDTMKSTTCVGLICQYDSFQNLCLLQLAVHNRCLLIMIPNGSNQYTKPEKLKSLLHDNNYVKTGVDIHKDALHVYEFLRLTTNNCKRIRNKYTMERGQKHGLLSLFGAVFKWRWSEKAEVLNSNWSSGQLSLDQIKYAALSAWSSHLICTQLKDELESFCLEGIQHQLLHYFQRSFLNVHIANQLNNGSYQLTNAKMELQQGFLVFRQKNINTANNEEKSEEFGAESPIDKNRVVKDLGKQNNKKIDSNMISKMVVGDYMYPDVQQQKLENSIHDILCNPVLCPSHILMAVGCLHVSRNINCGEAFPPPSDISLNRFQVDAGRMMLTDEISAIIGPPGTGKTSLIAAIAKSWDISADTQEVLLCSAQQNVAVHHIAEILMKKNLQGMMLLMSNQCYSDKSHEDHKDVQDLIVTSGPDIQGLSSWRAKNRRRIPRIMLCTLAMVGSRTFYNCIKHGKVSYMIIDECSQTAEWSLIPCLTYLPHLKRLSVLGDPCQLPPYGNVSQSLFDLVATRCNVATLQIQYRMPKCIADFVSREFYRGALLTETKATAMKQCKSMIWVDLDSCPQPAIGGTSLFNQAEAEAIVGFCRTCICKEMCGESSFCPSESSPSLSSTSTSSISSSATKDKLVVLTLYEAQRQLISQLLRDGNIDGVAVHNVDSFQGQEAENVVISLVVGRHMSPFASDRRRACVLLSRAKQELHIFGNMREVQKCRESQSEPNIWRSLAMECERRGWVVKEKEIREGVTHQVGGARLQIGDTGASVVYQELENGEWRMENETN